MKNNIFKVGVEASGESLIGYKRHLDYIVGSFLYNKRNLSITGVKRIGKTSLAKESVRLIRLKAKNEFLIIELDLARCEDYLIFLRSIVRKTKREIEQDDELSEEEELKLLLRDCQNYEDDIFMMKESLEDLFREINRKRKIIIMIDEFDAATDIFTCSADFEFLRNLSANSEMQVSLLLISRRQVYMIEKRNSNNSTFHGIITSYAINGFEKEDLQEFYEKLDEYYHIQLPSAVKERISYYAGRSPYIWSMFGSAIVENFDSENGLDVDDLFQKRYVDMKDHYSAVYENLSTDMIYTEGKPSTKATVDKLVEILYGPSVDIKPGDIEILKELGYLDVNHDGRYYAISEYFTDYIRGKVMKLKGSFFENIIQTEKCVKNIISIEMDNLCRCHGITGDSLNDMQKKLLVSLNVADERQMKQYDKYIKSNYKWFQQKSSYLDVMSVKDSFKIIAFNWDDVFKKYFFNEKLENWKQKFVQCAKARNPVAHGHEEFFSDDERKTTEGYCTDILNCLSGYLCQE